MMLRQTLAKVPSTSRGFAAPAAAAVFSRRAFGTSFRAMAEGDVGAPPKTGGQGDAFQKREMANENYVVQQREREKLLELKKKLAEQQAHIQRMSDHIDELTKEQGGEQN
ncbi:mitochondrial ATPase inhibitor, IATP-domain-containing protein [Xylariaceae sp. FL0804]|nr:mitochondrial ATPase inhibitor, IATP-domain-containing protein [Xylariaceae sp. FL0804]